MRAGLTVSCVLLLAMTARAPGADWYTGASNDKSGEKAAAPGVAIDVTFDGTTQNAFSGALIGTIAPFAPLSQSGLRLRIGGFGGGYAYASAEQGATRTIDGAFQQGAAMVGYEWVSQHAEIAGYIGAEIAHNGITPNDPSNTVKGTRGGARIGAEFYANPTDDTMMSGVASYASDHNAYYARGKLGVAIFDKVFLGPEALALGDDFFHQWRLGAHVSGLQLGAAQFGVSGGYLRDQVRGSGAYGIIESRLSF
jgi:hypothetical protein